MRLTIRKSPQRKDLVAIAVIFISLSNNSLATSLDSSRECAVHFAGTVQKVVDSGAPFSIQNQKVKVTFKVDENFNSSSNQGVIGASYSLNLIKGGPHKFEVGHSYDVHADSGYLCRYSSL